MTSEEEVFRAVVEICLLIGMYHGLGDYDRYRNKLIQVLVDPDAPMQEWFENPEEASEIDRITEAAWKKFRHLSLDAMD